MRSYQVSSTSMISEATWTRYRRKPYRSVGSCDVRPHALKATQLDSNGGTKGDGVTQRLRRQQAVLPMPTDRSAHDVHRTRRDIEHGNGTGGGARIQRTKPHSSPTRERDPDDVPIDRLVAVPPYGSAGAILADQCVN